jgi:hypothetical protein
LERIGSTLIRNGEQTVWKVFFLVVLSHLVFLFGVFCAKKIKIGSSAKRLESTFRLNLGFSKLLARIGFSLCLVFFGYYVSKIGVENLALLNVLDFYSSDLSASKLRSLTSTEFEFGSYTILEFFNRQLSSFFALMILFLEFKRPSRFSAVIIFTIIIIQSLILLSNTEKMPLMSFLLAVFILRKVSKGDYYFRTTELVKAGLVLFS